MEVTIARGQEYGIDAEFIHLLNADFERMTVRPNLMARYRIAGNDTRGQELQKERLITEKQTICEILRSITLLEEDFNAGRLKREDAAARERAGEILNNFYKLPGEYVRTVNLIFSRFAEVAGLSADVLMGSSLILDKFIRSLRIHFSKTGNTPENFIVIGGAAIKFAVNGDRSTNDIDIEYASKGAFVQLLEILQEVELVAATEKQAGKTTKKAAVDMVVHASSNKARARREAVGIDGRIPEEAVFLLLKRYSVKRVGVQFAGPECLAIMKLSAAVGRRRNQKDKIQIDINDVDACLGHLLKRGKSLDDPQLRLFCTQEKVQKFIALIQDILPQRSESIIRNMTMARFPYMEPAKLDVSPEKTPNLTGVALVSLVVWLGLLVVRHWVAKLK